MFLFQDTFPSNNHKTKVLETSCQTVTQLLTLFKYLKKDLRAEVFPAVNANARTRKQCVWVGLGGSRPIARMCVRVWVY